MTHVSCFEPAQSPTGAPPGPTVPMACQDHIPHPRALPGRFRGDAPAFLLQTLNRRWAVGAERASGSLQRQSDGTRLEGGLGPSARWVFSWVGGLIGLPVWKLSHAPGARERSDIFLLVSRKVVSVTFAKVVLDFWTKSQQQCFKTTFYFKILFGRPVRKPSPPALGPQPQVR